MRRALMLFGDFTRTAEVALAEGEEGLRRIGFELFPADPSDARLHGGERG
jgi:hypothetical protein